ncbi:hypothetical protein B0H14DRAFT_3158300 [Mycena olivaceomarginata]|nr:hypothetical protein B0H14DRAFT_3158300 [Mycena olivaceomarginata]
MLDAPTSAETKASSSPKEELESLVSLVAALSQMSLDIAKHCLDVQSVAAQILHLPAPPPTWVSGIARTPDELEAAHSATEDDDSQVLHVVTVGWEPGLYATVERLCLGLSKAGVLLITWTDEWNAAVQATTTNRNPHPCFPWLHKLRRADEYSCILDFFTKL